MLPKKILLNINQKLTKLWLERVFVQIDEKVLGN